MIACTEAIAQGVVILSPEHLGIIQGALLAALVTAASKIACDAMEENGPPGPRHKRR